MPMEIRIIVVKKSGSNEVDTGLQMNRKIFCEGVVAKVIDQILLVSRPLKRKFTQDEIVGFVKVGIENKFNEFDRETQFIRSSSVRKFHMNLESGIWEGATVTFVAMQIAYYMGFLL